MDIFWFKKAVSIVLHPIPLVLILLVLAWLLLLWSRRRRRGWSKEGDDVLSDYSVPKKKRRPGCLGVSLVFVALLLLYLCSIGAVSSQMMFVLERQYPPLKVDDDVLRQLNPEYIVVLPGAYRFDEERPITSRHMASTTARLVEAVRIHKSFPNARMVMTGGPMIEDWPSVASEMEVFVKLMGAEGEVILEEKARDTKDHALLLKHLLEGKNFVLVTSAYHMPRAMGLFRGQGLKPIAASAEIKFWPSLHYEHDQLIPSVGNLSTFNTAFHEYLGLLWAKMRGQLGADSKAERKGKSEDGNKIKGEGDEGNPSEEDTADEGETFVSNQGAILRLD